MAKKNRFVPISAKQIDECIALVGKACAPLGSVKMEPEARRRVRKMRKGGAVAVEAVAGMCTRLGIAVPGVSFDDVSAKLVHAERLAMLDRVVTGVLRSIRDEILVAQGDAWTAGLAAHGMLRSAEKASPDIANELAKVQTIFSRRASKKAPASKPSPSASQTSNGTDAKPATPAP